MTWRGLIFSINTYSFLFSLHLCILAVKSKPFFPAVPVSRSAIPAAVTVLITARDTGLNETISLCCLDCHLPAKWKYDESSVVIHHFLSRCSLLPLTSHLALPPSCLALIFSLQLFLFFICPPPSSSLNLIRRFSSPLLLSFTRLPFLLSLHFHLLLPPPPSLSTYHFSLHLSFPLICTCYLHPLIFSSTVTFNFPFHHWHSAFSCPLLPPSTGAVQCLCWDRWPPLSS